MFHVVQDILGPEGEFLYDRIQNNEEATDLMLTLKLTEITGPPHHGSTLFSRELYDRVGGYRPAFYYAQDLDLWIRLSENGRHVVVR